MTKQSNTLEISEEQIIKPVKLWLEKGISRKKAEEVAFSVLSEKVKMGKDSDLTMLDTNLDRASFNFIQDHMDRESITDMILDDAIIDPALSKVEIKGFSVNPKDGESLEFMELCLRKKLEIKGELADFNESLPEINNLPEHAKQFTLDVSERLLQKENKKGESKTLETPVGLPIITETNSMKMDKEKTKSEWENRFGVSNSDRLDMVGEEIAHQFDKKQQAYLNIDQAMTKKINIWNKNRFQKPGEMEMT